MREQLTQYVNLLFAGAHDSEDIRQEILQNTLDRYDDLIAAGKTPEAAYRLAISGIGDIHEILGTQEPETSVQPEAPGKENRTDDPIRKLLRAIAVGLYILCPLPLIVLDSMGMEIYGLCGTMSIVAVATVLIILGGKKGGSSETRRAEADEPKTALGKSISAFVWAIGLVVYLAVSFLTGAWHVSWVIFPILGAISNLICALLPAENPLAGQQKRRLRKRVRDLIWAVGLAVYFLLSFATMAWYITWVVFPIVGAVQGLTMAVWDLKEAVNDET